MTEREQRLVKLIEKMIKHKTAIMECYEGDGNITQQKYYEGERNGLLYAKELLKNDEFISNLEKIFKDE